MYRLSGHVVVVTLYMLASVGLAADQHAPSERYFSLLQEQPGNSYLFDRFYNTWLDTRTVAELESTYPLPLF